MKRLIGLVGYARVGKDVTADYLVSQHGFTRLASGDLVRDVLYAANPFIEVHRGALAGLGDVYRESVRLRDLVDQDGWELTKAIPEVRRLLQELGTEGVRKALGANVWIDETLRRANAISGDVVVTDTRFVNEAARISANYGNIWRIKRTGVGPINQHASETGVDNIKADATIYNDGSFEELYARIDAELTQLRSFRYDPWPGATDLGERHYTGGPLHLDVI